MCIVACVFQAVSKCMTHAQMHFLQLLNLLQANNQIEVELLQQQLKTSRNESTSLKCCLEAMSAALASANISSANPAVLMKAEGSHRGSGGYSSYVCLSASPEKTARLSPALAVVGAALQPAVCVHDFIANSVSLLTAQACHC